MFPTLPLGPLVVQVPGLLLLAGVWVALTLSEREATRLSLNAQRLDSLVLIAMSAGLISARLAYVARTPASYFADPVSLLALTPATLDAVSGFSAGALATFAYGWRQRLPFRLTLDALAPGLALMLAAVAAANFASGEGFGAPAQWPWSIFLWDTWRHPTQLYELAGAGLVFAAWYTQRPHWPAPGLSAVWVVGLAALVRLTLEPYRGDSVLVGEGWRQAQVLAWLVLAGCLFIAPQWAVLPTLTHTGEAHGTSSTAMD